MRKHLRFTAMLLAIAFLVSVCPAAYAGGIDTTEEITLSGLTNESVNLAVSRYFEERNAFLLGQKAAMEWPVVGIVNDENNHVTQHFENGIAVTDVDYVRNSTVCYNIHAETVVTETVTYMQNGITNSEIIQHKLTVYLDENGIPVVAADAYAEQFSGFASCSFTLPNAQAEINITTIDDSPCIVRIAKDELGVTETGTDMTKYGEWFGWNGVGWCIIFVAWCANRANVPTSVIPKVSGPYSLYDHFREQGRFNYSPAFGGSYTPVPGDILIVGTSTTNPTHAGIVEKVENGEVWIYDGNWSNKVSHHKYSLNASDILGYGHPNYTVTNHVRHYESDAEGHWEKCAGCGTETNPVAHQAAGSYHYDQLNHWRECALCQEEMLISAHVPVKISEVSGYKCRICGNRLNFVPVTPESRSNGGTNILICEDPNHCH